jgi:hypothetical protein
MTVLSVVSLQLMVEEEDIHGVSEMVLMTEVCLEDAMRHMEMGTVRKMEPLYIQDAERVFTKWDVVYVPQIV